MRKDRFELRKAEERAQIWKGSRSHSISLDEIIALIKELEKPESRKGLITGYQLTRARRRLFWT